jgi:calcineurin-like phosphoesterase family protein
MTTYSTSDWHVGHRLVSGIRGFWTDIEHTVPDVDAHSQALISTFDHVKPEDIIWFQGDMCVSESNWKVALELLRGLPGRKRLVCGNHDPIASFHRNAWKFLRPALEVFETVQDYASVKVGGKMVLLSHYPYSGLGGEGLRGEDGAQLEERFTEFRLTDCGRPLLHGHTHGPEKLHFSQAGTPQVHIGLDAWDMKLVSHNEVEKLLDTAGSSAKVEP